MRIIVRTEKGPNINFALPSGLIFNQMTTLIAPRFLKKHGVSLTRQQCARLIHALNDFRRHNRDWVFVKVDTAEGEHIEIRL